MSIRYRFRPSGWTPDVPVTRQISGTSAGSSSDSVATTLSESISGTSAGTSSDSGTPQAVGGIGTWRGNEPDGYTARLVDDHDDENGPMNYQNSPSNPDLGTYSISHPAGEVGVDGHGADGVFRIHMEDGFPNRFDVANAYGFASGSAIEWYVAFTVWFPSDWKCHTNEQKHLMFFWDNGHKALMIKFRPVDPSSATPDSDMWVVYQTYRPDGTKIEVGPGGVINPYSSAEPGPGYNYDPTIISRGEWHQIELQIVANTENSDHDFRLWLDGQLGIEETGVATDTNHGPQLGHVLNECKYTNTWGGGGGDAVQTQSMDIGHTYISGADA